MIDTSSNLSGPQQVRRHHCHDLTGVHRRCLRSGCIPAPLFDVLFHGICFWREKKAVDAQNLAREISLVKWILSEHFLILQMVLMSLKKKISPFKVKNVFCTPPGHDQTFTHLQHLLIPTIAAVIEESNGCYHFFFKHFSGWAAVTQFCDILFLVPVQRKRACSSEQPTRVLSQACFAHNFRNVVDMAPMQ